MQKAAIGHFLGGRGDVARRETGMLCFCSEFAYRSYWRHVKSSSLRIGVWVVKGLLSKLWLEMPEDMKWAGKTSKGRVKGESSSER